MRKFQITGNFFVPVLGQKMGVNKAYYSQKQKDLVHDSTWRNELVVISGYVEVSVKDKRIKVRTEAIRKTIIEDINFPELNVTTHDRLFSDILIVFHDIAHPLFAFKYEKDIKYLLYPDGRIINVAHKDKFYETLH